MIENRIYFNPKNSPNILVRAGHRTKPLPHKVYHSPTGMTWGYMGSGPHDTARSILYDYCRYVERYGESHALLVAERREHQFCMDFVCGFQDGWQLDADTIHQWWTQHPIE